MNKNKIAKTMPTVLFVAGIVGIFVSEVMVARDTLKAEKVLYEKNFKLPDEPTQYADNRTTATLVRDKKTLILEEVKATWKCYIPTFVATSLTLSALIASKRLTAKQIAMLSTAVTSVSGLVGKYRNEIREQLGDSALNEIDKRIASSEIVKAKAPVISNPISSVTEYDEFNLNDNEEVLFFDEFTGQKFYSTKLAFLGAKYYLNRNFAIGGGASLSMFYAFLGLTLPEEFNYAGWDCTEMDGYYWVDIDCVKSDEPDPETGKLYYTIIYGLTPGDTEYSYSHYPAGNPLDYYGSSIEEVV